jgi:hypothetical protein
MGTRPKREQGPPDCLLRGLRRLSTRTVMPLAGMAAYRCMFPAVQPTHSEATGVDV